MGWGEMGWGGGGDCGGPPSPQTRGGRATEGVHAGGIEHARNAPLLLLLLPLFSPPPCGPPCVRAGRGCRTGRPAAPPPAPPAGAGGTPIHPVGGAPPGLPLPRSPGSARPAPPQRHGLRGWPLRPGPSPRKRPWGHRPSSCLPPQPAPPPPPPPWPPVCPLHLEPMLLREAKEVRLCAQSLLCRGGSGHAWISGGAIGRVPAAAGAAPPAAAGAAPPAAPAAARRGQQGAVCPCRALHAHTQRASMQAAANRHGAPLTEHAVQ